MASDPHDNIRKEREEEEEEEGGNGGGIEIMELVDQDQEDQTGMQITAVAVEDSGVSTKGKINKYHECLKNHAASIGGHAIDGCCEFMPSGEEGTLEALKCAACNCHRNFHRRETEEDEPRTSTPGGFFSYRKNKGPFYSNPKFPFGLPTGSPAIPPLIMGCGGGGTTESSSEDLNNNTTTTTNNTANNNDNSNPAMAMIPSKKRFRTKFTQDQKEKMLGFAEKLGWRIQKQDEAAIQQFCAEVGVKRHVLKVWMHNNKHTMKKPQ